MIRLLDVGQIRLTHNLMGVGFGLGISMTMYILYFGMAPELCPHIYLLMITSGDPISRSATW